VAGGHLSWLDVACDFITRPPFLAHVFMGVSLDVPTSRLSLLVVAWLNNVGPTLDGDTILSSLDG